MKGKDNSVFLISLIVVFSISLWGILAPEGFGQVANGLFAFLTDKFGWFYLLAMFFFVIFMFGIAVSKFGQIRLGDDDSKPEYSYTSWFAMLFSAGDSPFNFVLILFYEFLLTNKLNQLKFRIIYVILLVMIIVIE